MRNYDTIMAVATAARKWAERTNRRRKYPHESDLCGFCAIASVKLLKMLKEAGIRGARINDARCHCFVTYDGHIIDVTATQFPACRDSPVVVIKMPDVEDLPYFWSAHKSFSCEKKYVEWQKKVGWPKDQIASNKIVRG